MVRAYGARAGRERSPVGADVVASLATVVSAAVATGWSIVTIGSVALVVVLARGRALLVIAAVGCAVTGVWRAEAAWIELQPRELGEYRGWALVVDDPQPYASSTRVLLHIEGERFESWHRGRAVQIRVSGWRAGERVYLSGDRRALEAGRGRRVAWQHVVGEFRLEWASDTAEGSPGRSGLEPGPGGHRARSRDVAR